MEKSIQLLFFGELAEVCGSDSMEFEVYADTDRLHLEVLRRFPELAHKRYRMAVNQSLIEGTRILSPGDTVAFLPPFAGG